MNNNQFTDKNLASLAAIMLLAPAVQIMVKQKTIDITEDEAAYIKNYVRYGYRILTVLALALIVQAIYSFALPLSIFYRTNYALLGAVIAMIIMGVFAIINNKSLIHTTQTSGQNPTNTETDYNAGALTYFIPLYNYYIWYNEKLEGTQVSYAKESVLLRSLYLIIISIRPYAWLMFLGAFVVMTRAIMVVVGMDIFGANTKAMLSKIIYRNGEELVAYPLALITNSIKKIFQRPSTLVSETDSWKLTYAELDPIGHRRTILQYLIAAAAIAYRAYTTWLTSGPSVGLKLAFLPQIFWIGKMLMTIPSGTLPRIPVLYTLLGGKKTKQT